MADPVLLSPAWRFATASVSADGEVAELTMKDANGAPETVPLVQTVWWKHLVREGFKTGTVVVFREHHGEHRVEMQLASKMLPDVDLTLLLQNHTDISLAPVPKLQVTIIEFPIPAVGWTNRMVNMTSRVATGDIPIKLQHFFQKNAASFHEHGKKLEITGPITDRAGLLHFFNAVHKSKAGLLDWASGERGTKFLVSKPDQKLVCESIATLFEFVDTNASTLEELAMELNDDDLTAAIDMIFNSVRDDDIPLGHTDLFMLKIRKFFENSRLLNRTNLSNAEEEVKRKLTTHLIKLWTIQNIDASEFTARLRAFGGIGSRLLRNTSEGPEAPVHSWCHAKDCPYHLSVVVLALLEEVAIGLARALCLLFGKENMPLSIKDPVVAIHELNLRAPVM
jgi:hypothetical protein